MFQFARRAFRYVVAQVEDDSLYGKVETISDQKIVFAGCAEDTLEGYRHVSVHHKNELCTYIVFHDEMPAINKGDFISFKTRDLGHDDYGSRKAINLESVNVIMRGRQPVVAPHRGLRLVSSR